MAVKLTNGELFVKKKRIPVLTIKDCNNFLDKVEMLCV